MDAIVLDSVTKVFQRHPGVWPRLRQEVGTQTLALGNVSLCIASGTVQVLLGPNGSGKTTLLKLISTMLLPDSGTLAIHGFDTQRHGAAVRGLVGFAVANERSFFPRLSAPENLDFFGALDNIPRRQRADRIREILDTTGLLEHADKPVMTFSSGMYQRLAMARALLKNPSVILLDEPSRSLDPGSAARLWRLARQISCRGATVIVATHSFQEALAVGDNVAVLARGKLAGRCGVETALSSDGLRRFYFDAIGENDDELHPSIPTHDSESALAG